MKKMRDPENPHERKESPQRRAEAAQPLVLATPEQNLENSLRNSTMVREAHGIQRLPDGKWKPKDLAKIEKLPEWQKAVLRKLIREG